jgi:hypothetical protein
MDNLIQSRGSYTVQPIEGVEFELLPNRCASCGKRRQGVLLVKRVWSCDPCFNEFANAMRDWFSR